MGGAGVRHVELLGRGARHVEHAAPRIGPAIVDPHHGRTAIVEVGHPDHRGHLQGAMGCRMVGLIVSLAVGSGLAVEAWPVPRGDAGLDVLELFHRRVGDTVDRVGRSDLVHPAAGRGAAGRPAMAGAAGGRGQHEEHAAGADKVNRRRTRADYG